VDGRKERKKKKKKEKENKTGQFIDQLYQWIAYEGIRGTVRATSPQMKRHIGIHVIGRQPGVT